jgi:hypothetical protein
MHKDKPGVDLALTDGGPGRRGPPFPRRNKWLAAITEMRNAKAGRTVRSSRKPWSLLLMQEDDLLVWLVTMMLFALAAFCSSTQETRVAQGKDGLRTDNRFTSRQPHRALDGVMGSGVSTPEEGRRRWATSRAQEMRRRTAATEGPVV